MCIILSHFNLARRKTLRCAPSLQFNDRCFEIVAPLRKNLLFKTNNTVLQSRRFEDNASHKRVEAGIGHKSRQPLRNKADWAA